MSETPDPAAAVSPGADPLDAWAHALLERDATPLATGAGSASWTGRAGNASANGSAAGGADGTPICLVVEFGSDSDPLPARRALDYATRTGTPLITVLVDGGASANGADLRAAHLLSGVVPHLAIESGIRTASGSIRAAAADFAAAVSVEPEGASPHFSSESAAAAWALSLVSRLPANRTIPAPVSEATRPTAPCAPGMDPLAVVEAISDSTPITVGPVSASLRCGFSTLSGHTVGFACSTTFAGDGAVSDVDLRAAARILQFCDAFHLPMVMVLDTPGLAHGSGAAALNPLIRALAEAATPLAILVTDRAGAPLGGLVTDPALAPEVLAWPAAAAATASPAAGARFDRIIEPRHTAAALHASLARWGAVDAPLPTRRTAVAPR